MSILYECQIFWYIAFSMTNPNYLNFHMDILILGGVWINCRCNLYLAPSKYQHKEGIVGAAVIGRKGDGMDTCLLLWPYFPVIHILPRYYQLGYTVIHITYFNTIHLHTCADLLTLPTDGIQSHAFANLRGLPCYDSNPIRLSPLTNIIH